MNPINKVVGHPGEKTRDEIDTKLLRELAALPANKFCFDCGQRGPTYVNVTIGAFVCSSCGGLLRGLNPPHRVKSLTVCSFTELEMDRIKSRGNEYCTHIWLGKYDPKTENRDLSSLDKKKEFMILKYEEKRFYIDPREAIKKMKPRAPAVPNSTTVPRSQTVITNKQSTLVQRPVVLTQAFSAGDISSNTVPVMAKAFENDPFQDGKNDGKSGDSASFADFNSAFGNPVSVVVSKESSSIQSQAPSVISSSSHKKPAPPPPDRYAALADLDNQLHQQVVPDLTAAVSSSAASTNSSPYWSAVNPVISTASVFAPGVPNPFQNAQPWPQSVSCAPNPFQVVTQPIPCRSVIPASNTNGMPCTTGSSLPNGNVGGAVYWPVMPSQPWGAVAPLPNNQPDPFSNKPTSVMDNYNPWAQSLGTKSVNPFENVSSGGNTKNPFL